LLPFRLMLQGPPCPEISRNHGSSCAGFPSRRQGAQSSKGLCFSTSGRALKLSLLHERCRRALVESRSIFRRKPTQMKESPSHCGRSDRSAVNRMQEFVPYSFEPYSAQEFHWRTASVTTKCVLKASSTHAANGGRQSQLAYASEKQTLAAFPCRRGSRSVPINASGKSRNTLTFGVSREDPVFTVTAPHEAIRIEPSKATRLWLSTEGFGDIGSPPASPGNSLQDGCGLPRTANPSGKNRTFCQSDANSRRHPISE
jgi:hypothetical protein